MVKIKNSMQMLPKQDFSVNNIHYDKNGNLLSLNRAGISNEGLPRDQLTYQYNQGTNQLNHVLDAADATSGYDDDFKGQNPNNYIYNQAGKLEEDQQQNTKYIYNAMGKVSQVRKLDTDALILSIEYNTNGQRLKKTTYNQEGEPQKHTWYVNSSAGVLLATYEQDIANEDLEATLTQTPIYGLDRIGVQNYTTTATGVRQTLAANYELKDHLGNVRVVILDKKDSRGNAIPISVNNFYPFGGNMPGETHSLNPLASNIGYQGQMYDEELGLYAFDLRMYNPHLGRWLNPDPYRQHHSPYLAMSNNPISFVDPDGGSDGIIYNINLPEVEVFADRKDIVLPQDNTNINDFFTNGNINLINFDFNLYQIENAHLGIAIHGPNNRFNNILNKMKQFFTPDQQQWMIKEFGFELNWGAMDDLAGNMSHLESKGNIIEAMDISNLLTVAGLMQSDLGKHFISHFMKKGGTALDLLKFSSLLTQRGISIVSMLEENGPVLPTSKRQFEKNESSTLKDEVEVILDGYHIYGNFYPDSQYIEYNFKILKNGKFDKDSTYNEAF